jgi:spore coat polysaccharide biosynthesis protein SpsF (cytidylyltransferase family)
MTVGVIIQARMGSTRLPGKVLLPLGGKPSIVCVLERASQISGIDRIVVATTTLRQDLQLVDAVRSAGYEAIMPTATPDNVLSRYYWTAKQLKFDTIVRITGDCPLLDPAVSSRVVGVFESERWDYVSNRRPATFPDGFDTEDIRLSIR